MFEKLKFWKKNDDFDFDQFLGNDKKLDENKETSPLEQDPLVNQHPDPIMQTPSESPAGFSEHEQTPPSYMQQSKQFNTPIQGNTEIELISSKLDTIKAILQNLDQRLQNIERAAGVEKKDKLW